MKIKILSVAENDIEEGYRFYESQDPGLGSYGKIKGTELGKLVYTITNHVAYSQ